MQEFRGHHFLPELFPAHPVIIDLGAHHGEFSGLMRKYFNANGVYLEANPELIEKIPEVDGFRRIHAAASGQDGELSFRIDSCNAEGGSVAAAVGSGESVTVKALSFATILDTLGSREVDLVKMDIESAELELIKNTSLENLAKVRQWTIEFHDFARPDEIEPVKECLARLRQAGFLIYRCCLTGHKDVLAVRRDCIPAGILAHAGIAWKGRWLAWRRMFYSRVMHRDTGVNH